MKPSRLSLFCLLLVLFSPGSYAGAADEEVIAAIPLQQASRGKENALFELIDPSRSGVRVRFQFEEDHPMRRLYPFGWATGNVAIGDVDGDNRADLFFPGTTGSHRLFLQKDGFRFEDVTEIARLGGSDVWGSAAIMADIDNDRDLDIYVVNYGQPNQLFVNYSGDGVVRFQEMAKEMNVAVKRGGMSASFVDADSDGYLDLFIQTYHEEPEGGRPSEVEITEEDGDLRVPAELQSSYFPYRDKEGNKKFVEAPQEDLFFHNVGGGRFELVTDAGFIPGGTYGTGHLWWDMDHDLQADLYLGNDSHGPDLLYRKTPGKFVEAAAATLPVTAWNTRGMVAADFNNDLLIDCFVAGSAPLTYRERLAYGEPNSTDYYRIMGTPAARQMPWNAMYANTGTALFREIAGPAGVRYTGTSWAAKAGDYDCDGRADLFITNGQARDWTALPGRDLVGEALTGKTRWDLLQPFPRKLEKDIAYRNLGDWNFEDVSSQWGLDFEGMSYCAGQGDLDSDGDLDLVVCTLDGEVRIYRNNAVNKRVVFQLFGIQTNRLGIGTEMFAEVNGKKIVQQMYPTGGFKGSDEAVFHLGLGSYDKVDKVTFRWPVSGAIETFENLKAGFRYTVKEAISLTEPVFREKRKSPMFTTEMALRGAGRKEVFFDEFESQVLLPPGLSKEGPALALSDIDHDGLAEILLGGPALYPASLIARSAELAGIKQPFDTRREAEDGQAVFFDADGDGDEDLFVASGGIEYKDNVSALTDRLYIQGEGGQFADESRNRIPSAEEISSAVAVADVDRDGDLDIFVGARFKGGSYPSPGVSRLLLNDGKGVFTDATDALAPGLKESAMISGAIWSDVNDDGWIDLMLACDMGSPQYWENQNGKLVNQTARWGLLPYAGRWNGLSAGDVDNDGDIDYLMTNEGLSGYGGPRREMLVGEFGGNQGRLLIDTIVEDSVRIPLATWNQLIAADKGFTRFGADSRELAATGLTKLFSPENIESSTSWSSNTLETALFINRGAEEGFDYQPLPKVVQVSTAYGSVIGDLNFDGRADLYLVQNRGNSTLRHPDPANRGVSQLFLGKGSEGVNFETVSPDYSGLIVFGSGRAIVTTDLNRDEKPDLIVSMSDSDPAVFFNRFEVENTKPIAITLGGGEKSPAGARVTISIPGFPKQTAEYYAGGGYYNQSSPTLFFGAPKDAKSATAEIRWGDGSTSKKLVYFE